jgi:hypothetical protein
MHVWRTIRSESPLRPLLKACATIAYRISPRCFEFATLYDALPYPHYALGLQMAARHARHFGISGFTAAEFGVAGGSGLVNLVNHAAQISRLTGLTVDVTGFDSVSGLPAAHDWCDVPWRFNPGDYPCDLDTLGSRLDGRANLRIGEIASTLPRWLSEAHLPLGFISIDTDYYSTAASIVQALNAASPERFVPIVSTWLDDIHLYAVPDFAGELAAIQEQSGAMRRFSRAYWPAEWRPYSDRLWLRKLYELFVLDHPLMRHQTRPPARLDLV